MPENRGNNCQTLVIDARDFRFEPMQQENGLATVIRFKVDNPEVLPGDVLLILAGSEIHFHGMIGSIEAGYAIASDPRGSRLPACLN